MLLLHPGMRIEVRARIEIAASAATVWRVLTDLSAYPAWNPFIRHARGSLEPGGEVRVRVRPQLGIPLAFRARVMHREERRELRWYGTFGGRWLASGDHRFTIRPSDGGVVFEQSEIFGGYLPRLARKLLERQALAGFEAMNRALAYHAEHADLAPIAGARAKDART